METEDYCIGERADVTGDDGEGDRATCLPPGAVGEEEGERVRFGKRDAMELAKQIVNDPIGNTVDTKRKWLRLLATALIDKSHPPIKNKCPVCGDHGCRNCDIHLACARICELEAKLNTPELHDFATGVVSEAQHQRARWGSEHDAGKEPQDWFWLLGYLAGKALKAHASGDTEKALHHTISSAAVLANWHASILGASTEMRPGIDPDERGVIRSEFGKGEAGGEI